MSLLLVVFRTAVQPVSVICLGQIKICAVTVFNKLIMIRLRFQHSIKSKWLQSDDSFTCVSFVQVKQTFWLHYFLSHKYVRNSDNWRNNEAQMLLGHISSNSMKMNETALESFGRTYMCFSRVSIVVFSFPQYWILQPLILCKDE